MYLNTDALPKAQAMPSTNMQQREQPDVEADVKGLRAAGRQHREIGLRIARAGTGRSS